jgi:hypothetical protein
MARRSAGVLALRSERFRRSVIRISLVRHAQMGDRAIHVKMGGASGRTALLRRH